MNSRRKIDALRRAGHKLAEYIANCVKELEPEETEVFDLGAMIKRGEEVEKTSFSRICDAAAVSDGRIRI